MSPLAQAAPLQKIVSRAIHLFPVPSSGGVHVNTSRWLLCVWTVLSTGLRVALRVLFGVVICRVCGLWNGCSGVC